MEKRLILPALLLVFMVAASAAAAEVDLITAELLAEPQSELQPASGTGRFLLYDAQLPVTGLKGPEAAERHLLKIDTVTGQTWIGKQVQYLDKKGKVVLQRYWEPFEQYLEAPAPPAAQGR